MPGDWDVVSTAPASSQAPPAGWDVVKHEPDAGPLSRFGTGLYDTTVGPVVQAVTHPIDTATDVAKTVLGVDDFKRAAEMVKNGHPVAGVLEGLNTLAEGPAGRITHQSVDPIVSDVSEGNLAGAAGRLTGTAASLLAPKLVPPAVAAAGKLASAAVDVAAHPVTRDVVGLAVPQAAHALSLLNRGAKLLEKLKSAPDAPTASTEVASRPILDEIAANPDFGGKLFDKLTPDEQKSVRKIADNIERKGPPALPAPGPLPAPIDLGEPVKPATTRPAAMPVRTPLRPPLAEAAPPLPEQPAAAPGQSAGPVKPPLNEAAKPYMGGENAPSAPEAANRAKVADKIGTALAKAGITAEHIDQVEALPAAQARQFWEAAGSINREGYVPSSDTISGIREIVKAKETPGPKLVIKPKAAAPPATLANNPKALKIAQSLRDLMQEK